MAPQRAARCSPPATEPVAVTGTAGAMDEDGGDGGDGVDIVVDLVIRGRVCAGRHRLLGTRGEQRRGPRRLGWKRRSWRSRRVGWLGRSWRLLHRSEHRRVQVALRRQRRPDRHRRTIREQRTERLAWPPRSRPRRNRAPSGGGACAAAGLDGGDEANVWVVVLRPSAAATRNRTAPAGAPSTSSTQVVRPDSSNLSRLSLSPSIQRAS